LRFELIKVSVIVSLVHVDGPGKGAVAHNMIRIAFVSLAAVQDVLLEETHQEENAVVDGVPTAEVLFWIEARLQELHELKRLDVDELLWHIVSQVADHQLLV
jgi:hypothetical protein